jgi:hypothetical protein
MTMELRKQIEAALAKRLPADDQDAGDEVFDPWGQIIKGIFGGYSSESDVLAIRTMEAIRDRKTFDLINAGFQYEFMLYVLSGHGMTNYGTSPRGAWPDESIADLWQPLIDKWRAYYVAYWGEPFPEEDLNAPS